MSEGWKQVPLSEAAEPVERPDAPLTGTLYRQIGVRLWGEGAYERETIDGSQTKYATLSRVEANDIIVNKIWARNGSVAVVPASLSGCYCSGEFPTFVPIAEKLYPRWLHWLTKTKGFWEQCDEKSRGTSGKNRIKPEQFLRVQIPLPPLPEQRRIVARIDELATKIEIAKGLRRESIVASEVIFSSAMNQIWSSISSWKSEALGQIAKTVSGQIDPKVEPYCNLPHINGENIQSGTCRLLRYNLAKDDGVISGKYHFRPNSILYSKLRPYLRKAVQVPVEGICSADIYAFDTISQNLVPRFFMYSLISPHFTEYANLLSGRTRMPKLNQDQLFAYQMSYPNLNEQVLIVAYLDCLQAKVDALKALQAETAAELNALLPSVLDRAFSGRL